MLNRRRVLLGGTALAAAATVAKAPLAASALAREPSAEGRAGDDVIACGPMRWRSQAPSRAAGSMTSSRSVR
jgi:hypothetical protein